MKSYIRFLPDSVINKIAAGEIVADYFGIIKELVENSIDAGATRIQVFIDLPITSIVVKDNGIGMSLEDLRKSVLRHTTSKLLDDDLLNISTFGFRGEALAAIGSKSEMRIETNVCDDIVHEISVKNGNIERIKSIDGYKPEESGTLVEVKNIFFNTPVILKWIENNHDYDAILQFIKAMYMSHTNIEFRLYKNNRSVIYYPKSDKINIGLVFSQEIAKHLKYYHVEDGTWSVTGYASPMNNNLLNTTSIHQYFFVNGRYIYDKHLSSTIRKIYHPLFTEKHPYIIALFHIPEGWVDINVHPCKSEVRFRDINKVRDLLRKGILSCITKTEISSRDSECTSMEDIERNAGPIRILSYRNFLLLKYQDELYLLDKIKAYCKIIKHSRNIKYIILNTIVERSLLVNTSDKLFYDFDYLYSLGISITNNENHIKINSMLDIYSSDKIKGTIKKIISSPNISKEEVKKEIFSCAILDYHQLVHELINLSCLYQCVVSLHDNILEELCNRFSEPSEM